MLPLFLVDVFGVNAQPSVWWWHTGLLVRKVPVVKIASTRLYFK